MYSFAITKKWHKPKNVDASFIVIGDYKSGKTTVCKWFLLNTVINTKESPELSYCNSFTYTDDAGNVETKKLDLFDCNGEYFVSARSARENELNYSAREYYSANAKGILMCYSVTDMDSYHYLIKCLEKFKFPNIVVAVTKFDEDDRIVTVEQGNEIANRFNVPIFELSAKMDIGFHECLRALVLGIKHNVQIIQI